MVGSPTAKGCLPLTLERLELAARTVVFFPAHAAPAGGDGAGASAGGAPRLAHLVLEAEWVHTHDWALLAESAPRLVTVRAASEIWIRNYLRSRAATLEQVRAVQDLGP